MVLREHGEDEVVLLAHDTAPARPRVRVVGSVRLSAQKEAPGRIEPADQGRPVDTQHPLERIAIPHQIDLGGVVQQRVGGPGRFPADHETGVRFEPVERQAQRVCLAIFGSQGTPETAHVSVSGMAVFRLGPMSRATLLEDGRVAYPYMFRLDTDDNGVRNHVGRSKGRVRNRSNIVMGCVLGRASIRGARQNTVAVPIRRAVWIVVDVDAIPSRHRQVGKGEPVGYLDSQVADRGLPSHPDAAVLQIPVRGAVFVQRHVLEREIGSLGRCHVGVVSGAREKGRCKQIVPEYEPVNRPTETRSPRLGRVAETGRGVTVEDVHHTTSHVAQGTDVPKAVLE